MIFYGLDSKDWRLRLGAVERQIGLKSARQILFGRGHEMVPKGDFYDRRNRY